MDIPVLFLIFNRPDVTARVFSSIREAKPLRLYVAADGPRENYVTDKSLCDQTRKIIENVDWQCQIKLLFREKNLGCKHAVSSAISWFFDQEDKGIILEDDCLPEASFFSFCEAMLYRYQDDLRISHVGGANFQRGLRRGDGDYYFSNLTHVWGWASWRRVWQHYDVNMKLWPQFESENYLSILFPDAGVRKMVYTSFEQTFLGKIDTWDYQLFFSNLVNGGLSIIPSVNLISNLGFNANATHTVNNTELANMSIHPLTRFNAPVILRACSEADLYTLKKNDLNRFARLERKLQNYLKGIFK